MNTDLKLEESLAHLIRQVEELSDVIARQDRDIATLSARVEMLMTREAEREADASGTAPLADQKPPHW
jgi:SlyX protein